MAKRILDALNNMAFSVEFAARFLASNKSLHARRRMLAFARAIITELAWQDQHFPDPVTKDAKRLEARIKGKSRG